MQNVKLRKKEVSLSNVEALAEGRGLSAPDMRVST